MSNKKTLLIIVTGSGENYWSEHKRIEPFEKDDNVDVAMIFWGDKEHSDQFWMSAKYIHKQKGNKFHLIRDFFALNQKIIDEYDRFFIMDDDIYMSRYDFMLFINIFETFDFDLACPGFYREAGNSRFHRRRATIYRTLNTVDVGAVCMTKRAFLEVLPVMNASLHGHGWGIAEWWLAKYHDRNGRSIHGGRIGCIDAAGAEHTRKMGADVVKLREGFGSQGKERNHLMDNFIGYRVDWWRQIRQYEYMTGEKLKNILDEVNKKNV